MSGECDKCGKHALECVCYLLLLDPETIEGDYNEAYQRWEHYFNKAGDKVQECFKETAFVPFEPFVDIGITHPNWKALAKSLEGSQKEMNNLERHRPISNQN